MTIGIYGFGEVGYHLAANRARAVPCLAYNHGTRNSPPYDRKFQERATRADVRLVGSVDDLTEECDLIIVATFSNAVVNVASALSGTLSDRRQPIVLDLTNAPPALKANASALLPPGHYVDGALLEPPKLAGRNASTIISGGRADECQRLAQAVLTDCTIVGDRVGIAAAYKSVLQILSKGYQALQWEAAMGAVATGLDLETLQRLRLRADSEAPIAFCLNDYLLAHSAKHATRMSDDLHGSVAALTERGVQCPAAEGAVRSLERVAALALVSTIGDDDRLHHDALRILMSQTLQPATALQGEASST